MKAIVLAFFLLLGTVLAAEKDYTNDVHRLKDLIQTP